MQIGTTCYLDPVNGNDANTGLTPELALKTLPEALFKAVTYGSGWTKEVVGFNSYPDEYRLQLPMSEQLNCTAEIRILGGVCPLDKRVYLFIVAPPSWTTWGQLRLDIIGKNDSVLTYSGVLPSMFYVDGYGRTCSGYGVGTYLDVRFQNLSFLSLNESFTSDVVQTNNRALGYAGYPSQSVPAAVQVIMTNCAIQRFLRAAYLGVPSMAGHQVFSGDNLNLINVSMGKGSNPIIAEGTNGHYQWSRYEYYDMPMMSFYETNVARAEPGYSWKDPRIRVYPYGPSWYSYLTYTPVSGGQVETVSGRAVTTVTAYKDGLGARLPTPDTYEFLAASNVCFTGWIDDASYLDGRPTITSSQISILSPHTSCRVLSPVWGYPGGITTDTVGLTAVEDNLAPAGNKQVVDSTPLTIERTVEWRTSDTPFNQTDVLPAWTTSPRNIGGLIISGKFVQYRVTLITNGV